MDKIATNNCIVTLRKHVKAAKGMVVAKLTRKIRQIKEEIDKQEDAALKSKNEAKIDRLHADIKLLKTIDNHIICKHALMKPDKEYWTKKIGDSKASNEECLEARVISMAKIQRQVEKFRSQNVDCDEWLEEYFEFREKKKDLMEATQEGKKKKMRRDRVREAREKRMKRRIEKRTGQPVEELKRSNREPKYIKPPEPPTPIKSNPVVETDSDKLHPSWASKRREKELLKKAFSGIGKTTSDSASNRVVLNAE